MLTINNNDISTLSHKWLLLLRQFWLLVLMAQTLAKVARQLSWYVGGVVVLWYHPKFSIVLEPPYKTLSLFLKGRKTA
jgi:hypothetical protein